MAKAADEMSHWPEYDYIIVNRDLDTSVEPRAGDPPAERLRRERQIGLTDFVRGCARGSSGRRPRRRRSIRAGR